MNVSPRQVRDPQLLEVVNSALDHAELAPSALTVEITEDLLLADSSVVEPRLRDLHALGVRLAVDDFGTGYSSLAYLRRLPVDILKIDRSFVSALTDGAKPTALVRSIVDLAAALDGDTIAEGVELKEQVEILKGLGCRVAQGFYFGEPRPARELDSMLQHGVTIPERMLGTRFRRTG